MLHARGQITAVLQQQHVDRLHRHTTHTTSAGMAHANGPTARATVTSTSWWWGQVYFWKIKIGGVHVIEGFPNATRQRPDHSSFTTAARRQTAPPHHTHIFCWHGPRQRSHGEGNCYFYQLVVGTGATSGVELWRRRYNPKGDGCYLSTDGLRMCNMYQ